MTKKVYLSDIAYQRIKEQLIKGELEKSVSENYLVEKLGMSRTPIREALHRLNNEDFLEIIANKGVFLKEVSIKETNDLMDLRLAVELSAMKEIKSYINEKHLRELDEIVEEQIKVEAKKDAYTFLKLDLEYHEYFLKIVGNNHFIKVLNNISDRLFLHGMAASRKGLTDDKSIKDHLDINEALRKYDYEKAYNLLESHILKGKSQYFLQ